MSLESDFGPIDDIAIEAEEDPFNAVHSRANIVNASLVHIPEVLMGKSRVSLST